MTRTIFYLHGAPGRPDEIASFLPLARENSVRLIAVSRFDLGGRDAIPALAERLVGLAGGRKFSLIGFSMGGFAALRCLPLIAPNLDRLFLVSPGVPLSFAQNPSEMAGCALFNLARRRPRVCRVLTALQGACAAVAPELIVREMFRAVRGEDVILARDGDFRRSIARNLVYSCNQHQAGYCRELEDYANFSGTLDLSICRNLTIYFGDQDNWAPPAMLFAFVRSLEIPADVVSLEGASHFSSLRRAMPAILQVPQRP